MDDQRLALAKQKSIMKVAELLAINGLTRAGREMIGPCPKCGGTDRFSINTQKEMFNCRRCGAAGDQIRLIEFVRGVSFREALDWLVGDEPTLSAAERQKLADDYQRGQAEKASIAATLRRRAIAEARRIWEGGTDPEGTPVRDYLTRRGIPAHLFAFPRSIRFHPDRPYMVGEGDGWCELHRGPAMLAAIQGPDGRFCGVHQTWIDLGQRKGKLMLADPKKPGLHLPAKKVHGSKKGGAIRLRDRPLMGAGMVIAEGIETTLSALVADQTGAAFWCGVDLGNMAGQRMLGRGQRFAGIPDMADTEAFVPPDWVRALVFVQDGDSEPRLTRAKLLSGCRRAMMLRRGLTAQIVSVTEGLDLNDVLMNWDAE